MATSITLGDLNFYHQHLKDRVVKELKKVQKDVADEIIDESIKKELSYKMQDTKRFRRELDSLYLSMEG